jgi:hypothetical protein
MAKGSLSQGRVSKSDVPGSDVCNRPLSGCESELRWVPSAAAPLVFIPGVEKTLNHLGQVSPEGANGCEGNIDKTMLSASFHELRNAAIAIDIHHNEIAVAPVDLDDLTQEGDFS